MGKNSKQIARAGVVAVVACVVGLTMPAFAGAAAPVPVVGGQETEREWPWMAYLEIARQEVAVEVIDTQTCGASLIAPTWVVTAAHCITDETLEPPIMTVVIGRHAKSDTASGERIQARRILVHPDYAGPKGLRGVLIHSGDMGSDAALIELERAPAGEPAPLKIAGPRDRRLFEVGDMATVLGWGLTSEGAGFTSDVLNEAQVPLVADADCGQAYSDPFYGWDAATMICAGYPEGEVDACSGDSGGPLFVADRAGGFRLVGLTSFGEGCARAGWPGVYAELAGRPLRDWVASHVPEAITTDPRPSASHRPAKKSRCQRPTRKVKSRAGQARCRAHAANRRSRRGR